MQLYDPSQTIKQCLPNIWTLLVQKMFYRLVKSQHIAYEAYFAFYKQKRSNNSRKIAQAILLVKQCFVTRQTFKALLLKKISNAWQTMFDLLVKVEKRDIIHFMILVLFCQWFRYLADSLALKLCVVLLYIVHSILSRLQLRAKLYAFHHRSACCFWSFSSARENNLGKAVFTGRGGYRTLVCVACTGKEP